MALRNRELHARNDDDVCRPIRRIADAVKVTEWLLILIGPSVEECFKSGIQIISDCMRE